jgi:hypothetical protein
VEGEAANLGASAGAARESACRRCLRKLTLSEKRALRRGRSAERLRHHMTTRQQRRASLSAFKKEASQGFVDVFLTPIEDVALAKPLHQRAVAFWRANIPTRRPACLSCKAQFAEDARVGSYLLMVPERAPTSASVSGLCSSCWSSLTDAEVERAALKIVRSVLPGATFGPP